MSETSNKTKIGKYEILDKIGEGGFGTVYHARDPKLERDVAIKILHANLASAPDFVERFKREARLTASLHHPNIVGIIEVDEFESRYYLVMEYLDGQPLNKLLVAGKPVPLTQAITWLHPMAHALDYAHSKGLIHRDIKPSNLIVTEEKRPVLTDFGLVKSMLEGDMTTTGAVLGTPEYMAPEQVQGKGAGPATDLYALGVLAYQMLTGQVPFHGKTPYEVQNVHVSQSPPDPRSVNPALLPEVAKILLHALEKEPAKRYPTCMAFVAELEKIADRMDSEQSHQIIQEVKHQMEKMNFDGAITRLENLQSVQILPEATNLLRECQRRKELWNQMQDLLKQQEQSGVQIKQVLATEKWLHQPGNLSLRSSSPLKKNITDKVLFLVITLFTLVALLLAINLGYSAPTQHQIDSSCLLFVNYGSVSPTAMMLYCGFVLALWLSWLVYKSIAWLVSRSRK